MKRRQFAALVGLTVVVMGLTTGCTTTKHTATRLTGSPVHGPTPLTPSLPTYTTTCGNFEVNATTLNGTVPLASCAGLAGMNPLPEVHVKVGDEVTISPPSLALTADPTDLINLQGTTLVALRPGTTVLTVHRTACSPPPDAPQPTTCALVKIVAS